MALQEMAHRAGRAESDALSPTDQQDHHETYKGDKPSIRFDFEGYSHRAIDWSLDGFRVQWHRLGSLREGDTFLIRGMAYGDLEAAPVFLRAEVVNIGHGQLAARFLDLDARGRRLFNDFMARWAIFELAADVA